MAESKLGTARSLQVLWGFRSKLMEGIRQDVEHRYAGSVLGLGWSILFPAVQIAIYAIVYVFIFKVRPSGITQSQYILMVLSGLVPLMAFNEALSAGTASLSTNKNLLTSTVFPPELIPVRALVSAQVPSLIGFVAIALYTLAAGTASWAALVLVPLLWLALLLFAAGMSWISSLLSLVARDIQQALPLFMMAMMILSPFAYTPEMVPEALKAILYVNPLSYFVFCFQDLLTFGRLPRVANLAAVALIGGGTFVAGFMFFRRAKHAFFDYA